jgi:hypothetical protein
MTTPPLITRLAIRPENLALQRVVPLLPSWSSLLCAHPEAELVTQICSVLQQANTNWLGLSASFKPQVAQVVLVKPIEFAHLGIWGDQYSDESS